ncbi:pyrroline-5-carboxylate reductase [Cytobacillus sp. IB215316]|uniref:pyrroline-5-carboxylate reductase n=1 Tax=Cytobacillus sp. IB215316 TaxID=3097354 RepID=UPI002A180117|nr:pyrroline-5-carboxylate reductase [Cytobacillus sp. IB215316]MDX8360425.1 pyrroline-5-carboxylate reductase [Cytobacillus sp. IB215316]
MKKKILFIGAGRMAEAIFSGLLTYKQEYIDEIIVTNRTDEQRLFDLKEKYGVTTSAKWQDEVAHVDIIILAMPPEAHKEILEDLSLWIKGQLVVTIAGGIGIQLLENILPEETPVAWIMPNTAANISQSMSLYTFGKAVKEKHRQELELVLTGIGDAELCTEQQIHDLTAITGSAPAFLYRFAEALEQSALEYGVTKAQARKLVTQMIYGSAAMLKEGHAPDELRDQVTSPGGSTAAGIEVLDQNQFTNIIEQAVIATQKKAQQLAGK